MTTSMRYSCAITSLQLTTCSRTLGRIVRRYISRSTPSSWLNRTKLVPTRIRSSRRSISLRSRSRESPECCSRTQSLFISIKLVRTKPIESWRFPPGLPRTVSHSLAKRGENVPWVVAHRKVVARHPAQVVSKEQAACRVLHAASHLHHVLHDLLDRRLGDGHVNGPNGHHEVCGELLLSVCLCSRWVWQARTHRVAGRGSLRTARARTSLRGGGDQKRAHRGGRKRDSAGRRTRPCLVAPSAPIVLPPWDAGPTHRVRSIAWG